MKAPEEIPGTFRATKWRYVKGSPWPVVEEVEYNGVRFVTREECDTWRQRALAAEAKGGYGPLVS